MPIRTEDEPEVPAKPRRARGWAFGCFGSLGVLGLALWAYVAWANMLPPPPPAPAVTLPNPNGYDAVNAVLPRLENAPGTREINEPYKVSYAALRKAVAQQKPLLDELRTALNLPFRNPPMLNSSDSVFRGMAAYRQAARALAAEGQVAAAERRPAEAWRSGLDALELGTKFTRGGVTLHLLVGAAVTSIAASRLDGEASGLTPAEARAAGARLERIAAELPPVPEILQEEHRLGLLSFREMVTAPPQMEEPFSGEPLGWSAKVTAVGLRYLYPKSWTYSALVEYHRRSMEEVRKPSWQRGTLPNPTDPYLEQLVMDPTIVSRTHSRMESVLHLLRLQVALAEFRGRTGRYPAALKELVPGTLARLPTDPFSGKPYVYRRAAGGYLLYGVGEDGVDNGGSPSRLGAAQSGDMVAGRLFPNRSRSAPGTAPRQ